MQNSTKKLKKSEIHFFNREKKLASIHPRTSPSKFGGNYSILFNRVLNHHPRPPIKRALKTQKKTTMDAEKIHAWKLAPSNYEKCF